MGMDGFDSGFAGPARSRVGGAFAVRAAFALRAVRVAAFGLLVLAAGRAQAEPRHVYLTWNSPNTASEIVVNFQTMTDATNPGVHYDVAPHPGGKPADYALHATGETHKIEGLPDGRSIHWVKLTGLEPGKPYHFIAGDEAGGFSAERKFHTLPADSTQFRFVTGGDIGVGDAPKRILAQAAKMEPAFVSVGGDLAYADGTMKSVVTWDAWIDGMEQSLVTPEGFTVPWVLAIGNHEVLGFGTGKPEKAVFWFKFFDQTRDGVSYFERRFGRDTTMLALDSSHITAHAMQKDWLRERLAASAADQRPLTFAIYHVPLYPAYRDFEGLQSKLGRDLWQPLFDEFHLKIGLENHDHVFKRTKPIKANAVAEDGTVYLGDGCFGKGSRTVKVDAPWYVEKSGPLQHFWMIDINGPRIEARAIDTTGAAFDVYPSDAPGAAEADAYFKTIPFQVKDGKLSAPPGADVEGGKE